MDKQTIEERAAELLKSDSVHYALRYANKNPDRMGFNEVTEPDDIGYIKLYELVQEIRKNPDAITGRREAQTALPMTRKEAEEWANSYATENQGALSGVNLYVKDGALAMYQRLTSLSKPAGEKATPPPVPGDVEGFIQKVVEYADQIISRQELADFMRSHFPTAVPEGWVSQTAKPEIFSEEELVSDSVLITDGQRVDVGHFCYDTRNWIPYGDHMEPTHWMRLPDPPKN